MAGEWNPADLGTKPLAATRHWKLCDLVGLVTPKHELESSYPQAKAKPSLQQCIKAVVLACCLGTVRGQPTQDTHDGSSDRLLLGVLVLIVIAAIALWEAGRHLMGRMRTFSQLQVTTDSSPPPRPPVEPQVVGPDRQPDAEDDLADLPPLHPVEAELEREEREREERERQLAEEQAQALYEEGLRRRGARVYGPEPDFEPPRPPSVPVDIEPPPRQVQGPEVAEHHRGPNLSRIEMQRPVGGPQRPPSPPLARRLEPPQHQQPLEQVIMYADDIAVVEPERRYADRGPPRLGGRENEEDRPQRREPWVRDYEEIRREVRAREAEQRALDLAPNPLLVINPDWGPPEPQPTLRWLRAHSNVWGGLASALHQLPPANLRRDFFQLDQRRGVLIRWHVKGRVRLFTPVGSHLPGQIELAALTGRRRSFIMELNRRHWIDDNYHEGQPQRTLPAEWRGRTELEINHHYLPRQP